MDPIKIEIGKIYKSESGRVLASLIRILGDLDLAEEALQEAFNAALEKWPKEGIPKNPYSWLVSTGKFKAIDSIRRLGRGRELLSEKFSLEKDDFNDLEFYDYKSHNNMRGEAMLDSKVIRAFYMFVVMIRKFA
ncbi:hypothetical protein IH785_18095 [candidate division KSB1 bacterium]|nr:hypothetical protein [candidate division KSB1 bacterium]